MATTAQISSADLRREFASLKGRDSTLLHGGRQREVRLRQITDDWVIEFDIEEEEV